MATKDVSSSTLPGKSAEVMSTNTIGKNGTGNTSRRSFARLFENAGNPTLLE